VHTYIIIRIHFRNNELIIYSSELMITMYVHCVIMNESDNILQQWVIRKQSN